MVHVPFHKTINLESNALVISSHRGGGDLGRHVIHFRAAVVGLQDVGPCLHRITGHVTGGLGIDLVGEGQLEAVGLGAHLVNFERHLARPVHAIERKSFAAASTPTAIAATHEEGAAGIVVGGNVARTEAGHKQDRRALIHAVDLFQHHAADV